MALEVIRRLQPPGNTRVFPIAALRVKSLKAGLIWRHKWQTRGETETAIFQYINGFYNSCRRHSYLGGLSSMEFEAKMA